MKLTLVLPFYNEEALLETLPDLLGRIRAALKGHDLRLLAVDDGSTDATAKGLAALAEREPLEVLTHEANRGPGAAMTTGIAAATGDAALVYDPDEAYAPACLARLVDSLDAADVATLSPYHPQGGVQGVGPLRLLLSRKASSLYRRRLRSVPRARPHPPLFTYTCAVRAYRLPAVQALLPAPDDFTAAAWLLAAAIGAGLRVVEVPATLRVRASGSSKMRVLRTIRAHLRLLRDLPVTASSAKSSR